MLPSRLPLIARARRHLLMVVRCLALVIVAKSALAAACVADGVAVGADPATVVVASSAAEPVVTGDVAHDPPCWHAGSGGCHCSCVHAVALPVPAADWQAPLAIAAHLPLPDDSARSLHIAPSLRPPIA